MRPSGGCHCQLECPWLQLMSQSVISVVSRRELAAARHALLCAHQRYEGTQQPQSGGLGWQHFACHLAEARKELGNIDGLWFYLQRTCSTTMLSVSLLTAFEPPNANKTDLEYVLLAPTCPQTVHTRSSEPRTLERPVQHASVSAPGECTNSGPELTFTDAERWLTMLSTVKMSRACFCEDPDETPTTTHMQNCATSMTTVVKANLCTTSSVGINTTANESRQYGQ